MFNVYSMSVHKDIIKLILFKLYEHLFTWKYNFDNSTVKRNDNQWWYPRFLIKKAFWRIVLKIIRRIIVVVKTVTRKLEDSKYVV